MIPVKLHFGYAGFCYASAEHAVKGDPKGKIKFHALWALIEHPSKGLILFDTGYTERFYNATRSWPHKIYALLTPVSITKQDELVYQLASKGYQPHDISTIVISHFHADHIGGLKDFPEATIVTSKKAANHTLNTPRWRGVANGILHDLLPVDIEARLSFVEECKQVKEKHLGTGWDLFGDESLKLFDLPGHAAGQIGMMVQTQDGPFFLISDACWDIRAITENKLPHPIVKLFFDDWKAYKKTLRRLQQFCNHNPDVQMVPTHCMKTTDLLLR